MADVVQFPNPPASSSDLVRILEALLADAQSGKLLFIAFVAEYSQNEYVVDIAGMTQQVIVIRKMLELLADKII